MALQNYQSSFNGLTWGAGTDIQVTGITGLRGMPSIRSGDVAKARRNGSFPGQNFFDERVAVFDLNVFGGAIPSGATVEQTLTGMAAAFQNIEDPAAQLPLATMLPGWAEPRTLTCRPTGYTLGIDTNYQFNDVKVAVQFTASDPLIYGFTLKSVSTGLPSPTAGLQFNVTFPAVFGASTGGSMQVANNGLYPTPPVFIINGPVKNPLVSLVATGQFFGVQLTLTATDQLVIDMNARTVTLNGTASRYNAALTGSSWFALPVGTSTIGVQSKDATAVAAQFTCQYRDAWGAM